MYGHVPQAGSQITPALFQPRLPSQLNKQSIYHPAISNIRYIVVYGSPNFLGIAVAFYLYLAFHLTRLLEHVFTSTWVPETGRRVRTARTRLFSNVSKS